MADKRTLEREAAGTGTASGTAATGATQVIKTDTSGGGGSTRPAGPGFHLTRDQLIALLGAPQPGLLASIRISSP